MDLSVVLYPNRADDAQELINRVKSLCLEPVAQGKLTQLTARLIREQGEDDPADPAFMQEFLKDRDLLENEQRVPFSVLDKSCEPAEFLPWLKLPYTK